LFGLKTVGTCDYLRGLLVFNNCEYQEFIEELPSKKAFDDANLFANQMYNIEIRKSTNYCSLTLRKCANIYLLRSIHYILKTLFLHPKNKWLTLNAIQEVSRRAKFWFHERRGHLIASHFGTVMKRRENVSPHHFLAKPFLPASNVTKPPETCQ
jgi:hypothetical protein